MVGGRVRRRKQVKDDRKEMAGYCKLKEALDRTLWRTGFGKGYGPVIRQTTKLINVLIFERLDNRLGNSPKHNIFCVRINPLTPNDI
jgi:hypothetical protein